LLGNARREHRQLAPLVRFRAHGLRVGPVEQRGRRVVAPDDDVKHPFEQGALGAEGAVDRVGRDTRPARDGGDRGGGIALFEEQVARTADDAPPGFAGLRLAERGVVTTLIFDSCLLSI
jgi:hypothetical protein